MDGDDGIGEILCPVDGDGRNSDKWLLRQSRFQVSQRRVPFNIPKVEAVGMDDEIDDVVEGGGCSIKRCMSNAQVGDHCFQTIRHSSRRWRNRHSRPRSC